MAVTLESFSLLNPNPNSSSAKKMVAMMALRASPHSMRSDSLIWCRGSALVASPAARGLSLRRGRSLVVLAASHEESKHSDMEIEKEKNNHNSGTEESQEAWKEALESFKEQALKIQSVSQEAYEIYSKKALIILKETSKDLKIQADKAGRDLSAITKELGEEGKEYFSTAAENSPEVKEIVETFTNSTDDFSDVSKIHDFRVGIPYGLLLSVGGFLSFMATGSTASLRFGVILGGALLALSISSLKAHKRGEKSTLPLKGQAAIASVLFLRDIRLLAQRSSIIGLLTTVLSGTVAAFFIYRITQDGKRDHGSHHGKTEES